MFCYDSKLTYPVYLSNQKFHDNMDLLLISNELKSHYVTVLCKNCLQCLSSEEILIEHKEDCLIKNGKESVKLESGYISFTNYFKQIPVPFKIYADFECIFKKVDRDIEHNSTSS